jgi:2-phosphosulfolactate phosphatase
MKIDVFLTPHYLDDQTFTEKTVVVIDVLRASTSIIYALESGAKEIIPVSEIREAEQTASDLFSQKPFLCGEREGKIIPGFDFGNSPEEFTEEKVQNATLVFCTTNGTRAIQKTRHAKRLLIGALSNVTIVKEFLVRPENIDTNLAIVCAGKENRFSLEDTICAGLLTDKLLADKKGQGFTMSDSAMAARALYEKFRGNELGALKDSEHGRYLTTIGAAKDIEFCAKIDSSQSLPVFEGGVVKLHTLEKRKFKRVD